MRAPADRIGTGRCGVVDADTRGEAVARVPVAPNGAIPPAAQLTMQLYGLVVTTALLVGVELLGLALLFNWRGWATRIARTYSGGGLLPRGLVLWYGSPNYYRGFGAFLALGGVAGLGWLVVHSLGAH